MNGRVLLLLLSGALAFLQAIALFLLYAITLAIATLKDDMGKMDLRLDTHSTSIAAIQATRFTGKDGLEIMQILTEANTQQDIRIQELVNQLGGGPP